MAVPKPHTGPTADKGRDWNWSENEADETNALLDEGGWPMMVEAHAWYDDSDGDPPEKKSAYKLPRHELINGELRVVWSGVAAAMNVLSGGRGGVKVPNDEVQAISAAVGGTGDEPDHEPDAGLLRLEFRDKDSLHEVDWDAFFRTFEDRRLAFLYQEETKDGELSRFNKFVSRDENS